MALASRQVLISLAQSSRVGAISGPSTSAPRHIAPFRTFNTVRRCASAPSADDVRPLDDWPSLENRQRTETRDDRVQDHNSSNHAAADPPISSPTSSAPAPTAASAYDDLFSGPNPFPKAHANGIPRQHPPPVEGNDYQRGLNARQLPGRMSRQETEAWVKLLEEMADSWKCSPKEDSRQDSPLSRFQNFARRNKLVGGLRASDLSMQPYRKKRTLGTGLGQLPSLGPQGEGPTPVSREDLEVAVDKAMQGMLLCERETDLWEWASKEIWGFDEAKFRRRLQRLKHQEQVAAKRAMMKAASQGGSGLPELDPDGATHASEGATAVVSLEQAPYGPTTPYYAAVIHRLFMQFRDRFQAPNSALTVLHVVRSLGPNSFVLGGTPELYSIAIRTRWEWLKDLHGAFEVFREARNAGLPCHGIGSPIYEAVQAIRDDVRRAVLSRRVPNTFMDGEENGDFSDESRDSDSQKDPFGYDGDAKQRVSRLSWPTAMDAPVNSILSSTAGSLGDPYSASLSSSSSSKTSPTAIDLSKLSLASLEALRMVDKMGELVSEQAAGRGRPLQQRYRRQRHHHLQTQSPSEDGHNGVRRWPPSGHRRGGRRASSKV